MVNAAIARLHPERALEAAGYVRVSLDMQADGHSPEVQRQAIKDLAAQQGYALTMIEEDHERGSVVTRRGYQKIIAAVRQGTIAAVIVFMFDRWGRSGSEWLTRAEEFDRLGVEIISVQEGRDEGGLMRFIRAGMAEEYSRQLARRVKPAHERAVRQGTHIGPTPFGFRRAYPAWDGQGRRPVGRLVPDEATAWIVRELFGRYASGTASVRLLTHWLNSDPDIRALADGQQWYATTVERMLHRPVYKGGLRYNQNPRGRYARAAPGDEFEVDGTHEGLVSVEMWETVQRRLAAAARKQTYNRPTTASGRPTALGASLLRCTACGGAMYAHRRPTEPTLYVCLRRHNGEVCAGRGYREGIARAALLAEVRRLRGTPWKEQAMENLAGPGGQDAAAHAAALVRALEHEQERMRRNIRRMNDIDEPTPEEIAAFREVGAEIAARIRSIEAEMETTAQQVRHLPSLKAIHAKVTETHLASVVDALDAQGDEAGLRTLLLELVESAVVVERRGENNPVWLRMRVAWKPDVQTLLDAGLLVLDEPDPGPVIPTPAERARARWHRAHERATQARRAQEAQARQAAQEAQA